MAVNLNKPHLWKTDIAASVDMYNEWFIHFAPRTFRDTRSRTAGTVKMALAHTGNLTNLTPEVLAKEPSILPMLRMATCPPIARDRLTGLAGVTKSLVGSMEDEENPRVPPRMPSSRLQEELTKIIHVIKKLADPDIFVWLGREAEATEQEIIRAATIVADRLCGAVSDPIIRNEQERRQLAKITDWLTSRGYRQLSAGNGVTVQTMPAGTFAFRMNVPVVLATDEGDEQKVNIPVDAVVMPKTAKQGELPLLIEAKSAGDFTNVNKRRKEEAVKMQQLRANYSNAVRYVLFLCGYFDSGYLGYEAAEGIDWVWEHRIDDLTSFGL